MFTARWRAVSWRADDDDDVDTNDEQSETKQSLYHVDLRRCDGLLQIDRRSTSMAVNNWNANEPASERELEQAEIELQQCPADRSFAEFTHRTAAFSATLRSRRHLLSAGRPWRHRTFLPSSCVARRLFDLSSRIYSHARRSTAAEPPAQKHSPNLAPRRLRGGEAL